MLSRRDPLSTIHGNEVWRLSSRRRASDQSPTPAWTVAQRLRARSTSDSVLPPSQTLPSTEMPAIYPPGQRRCRRVATTSSPIRKPFFICVSSSRIGTQSLEPCCNGRDPSTNGTSTHLVPVPRFGLAYLVRSSRLRPRTL
jgi:hypothetical protein